MPTARLALLTAVLVTAAAGSAACSKSESRFTGAGLSPQPGKSPASDFGEPYEGHVGGSKTTDELTPE